MSELKTTTEIFDSLHTAGIGVHYTFIRTCERLGLPERWVMHSSVVSWLSNKLHVVDTADGKYWYLGSPVQWDDTQPWAMTIEDIVKVSLQPQVVSGTFVETMCHLDYVL